MLLLLSCRWPCLELGRGRLLTTGPLTSTTNIAEEELRGRLAAKNKREDDRKNHQIEEDYRSQSDFETNGTPISGCSQKSRVSFDLQNFKVT